MGITTIIALVGLFIALASIGGIRLLHRKDTMRIDHEINERNQFQLRIKDDITTIGDTIKKLENEITTLEERTLKNEEFQKRMDREFSRKKVLLLAAGQGVKMAQSMQDELRKRTMKENEVIEIKSILDEHGDLMIPKTLLEVNSGGATVLDCLIEAFLRTGRRKSDIIVVSGYRSGHLSQYLANNYSDIGHVPYHGSKDDEKMLGTLIHAFNKRDSLLPNGFTVSYADLVFENFNDLRKLDDSDAHITFLMEDCDDGQPIRYRYGSKLARRKDREKYHPWDTEAEKVIKDKKTDQLIAITKSLPRKGVKVKGSYIAGEFIGVVRFTSYGAKIFSDYINSKKRSFYENASLIDVLSDIIKDFSDKSQTHIIQAITSNKKNKWWDIDLYRDLTTARISPTVSRVYQALFKRAEDFVRRPVNVSCKYCKALISNKDIFCPHCRKSLI